MITDIQVHTWLPDSHSPGTPPPHRPDGFSIEKLISEMDAIGVDRAVIVPPTLFSRRADAYALEAANRFPQRFRIFEQLDVSAPDARERLSRLTEKPYAGVRLLLHYNPGWLDGDMLEWFWSECERRELPIAAYGGSQMAQLAPIAERHPDLNILLDHMGVVPRQTGAPAFGTIESVVGLSRFPRVWVKLTSAPAKSAESYPYSDIYPYIKRLYEAFGSRRLLWGSDVSQMHDGDYRRCLDHVREALDFLSEDDKERVLGKNAAELLNWPADDGS
jgi:predicted TIM-barrel fold metal-dependent hydrolase